MGRRKEEARRQVEAQHHNCHFCDNTVTNSKYTKFTFLPLNLYEQFHRPINLYFLTVTLLQFIPAIAPVSPFSTLGPLAAAFALTAIKEGYDDLQRHRQDEVDNTRKYSKVDKDGTIHDVLSKDIKVGDLVFLEQGEEIPCDVIALLSENVEEGICYVSTENLDGESESKEKLSVLNSRLPPEDAEHGGIVDDGRLAMKDALAFIANTHMTLHCDGCNAQLRKFNGRLVYKRDGSPSVPVDLSCDINHLLLASSIVRNSSYIIGLVVYTGNETKVGMTKKFPPVKWARLDRMCTKYCMGVFIFQGLLTLTFGILGGETLRREKNRAWYLGFEISGDTPILYSLVIPMRFFLMLTVMVPISFKVMVDVSKYYISQVIAWDRTMYDMATDTPACVNNTSIAEDLGQIQFVMSDKTGTLTENKMDFKFLQCDGVTYGEEGAPLSLAALDAAGIGHRENEGINNGSGSLNNSNTRTAQQEEENVKKEDGDSSLPTTNKQMLLKHLLLNLVLNNVVQRHPESQSHSTSKTFFDAHDAWVSPSPDEVALVAGGLMCGYRLLDRTRTRASVLVGGGAGSDGEDLSFEILHVLPFTSERGKMSVVVRDTTTQETLVLMKGADERVIPLCVAEGDWGPFDKQNALDDLYKFSVRGLRTLVYGAKVLTEDETQTFLDAYQKASTTEGDSARAAAVSEVYAQLEQNVQFLGISAVEDRLQDDVAGTITKLRAANVRVWMLTGDKRETAKQIGISTGLTTQNDIVYELFADPQLDASEALVSLRDQLRTITSGSRMDPLYSDGTTAGGDESTNGFTHSHASGFSTSNTLSTSKHAPPSSSSAQRMSTKITEADIVGDIRTEVTRASKVSDDYVCGVMQSRLYEEKRRSSSVTSGNFTDRSTELIQTSNFLARVRGSSVVSSPGENGEKASLLANADYPSNGTTPNKKQKKFHASVGQTTVDIDDSEEQEYCVSISGHSLELLQGDDALLEEFKPLLLGASTVICCRVTPDQKALIVRLVKESGGMTLAIGDGGNDVAMIQEAHIGVGITGREGHQAARAADYSFAQFKFLATLMLRHGHTAFQRTAYIVQYSFYKSGMIAWVQLLFNMDALYSGVSYWDSFSLMMWNGAYTVLLTLFYAMDVHLDHETLLKHPQLYLLSQRSRYINGWTFCWYFLRGGLQCTLAYYVTCWLFNGNYTIGDGHTLDTENQYVPTYTGLLLLQFLTVVTESHSLNWLHWFSIFISVSGFFASFAVYSLLPMVEFYGSYAQFLMKYAGYWLGSIFICASCYIWHATYAAIKFWFFPSKLQLQRGIDHIKDLHHSDKVSILQSMKPTCS